MKYNEDVITKRDMIRLAVTLQTSEARKCMARVFTEVVITDKPEVRKWNIFTTLTMDDTFF